jgi:hypothetical protein
MLKKTLKIVFSFLCIIGLLCITACGDAPPEIPDQGASGGKGEKPYLKSESVVTYNNAPVSFEFVLEGYTLTVTGNNLGLSDYAIQDGVLTIFTDYFERENKKEYTFAYSLTKSGDTVNGTLTVNSVSWGDINWHQ